MTSRRIRRAVAVVVGGTAGAQLITLIASPALTRIYSPAEFGALAAFVSAAAVLSVISALRFELAVPVVGEADLPDVLRVGALASVAAALLCAVVVSLFGEAIARSLDISAAVLWWLPLAVMALALTVLLSQLMVRRREYHRFAMRKLVQAIAVLLIQVPLGLWWSGLPGLVIGYALGQVVVVFSLLPGAGLFERRRTHEGPLTSVLTRYRRFPLVMAPAGLLNTLGTQLPTFLILGLYGPVVAGFYGLAQRVLAAPVGLVGNSIAQVYIGELAESARHNPRAVGPAFRRVSRALWGVAVALGLAIGLVAPPVFGVVFGPAWRDSGLLAQALALGITGQLAAAPLSQTLVVAGMLSEQLAWDSVRVLGTALAVALPAVLGWGPRPMAIILGAVQAAMYVWLWWLCRKGADRIGRRVVLPVT